MFINIKKHPKDQQFNIVNENDKLVFKYYEKVSLKINVMFKVQKKFPLVTIRWALVSSLDDLFNENSNKYLFKSRIVDADGLRRRKIVQADLLIRKGVKPS